VTVALCIIALTGMPCPAHGGHATPLPARGGHADLIIETNVDKGRRLAERAGWIGQQWRCLYALWNRESGWQTRDPNPTSDADGIPQANPASKMGEGWENDPEQQISWGLRYIRGRYGSPCAAYAHSNAHNSY
jgi:hypothetical protein